MEGYLVKLLFICLELIVVNSDDIEFTQVSSGTIIIDEGLRFDIICSVTNTTGYSISWYRETQRGDRALIYRDGMLTTNNPGREAEAYSRPITHDVRITNVRGRDLGYLLNGNIYTCEVSVNKTGEVVLVSSGLTIQAHYSPSPVYPICESCQFSSDFINTSITISCYSEPGQPRVELMWLKNGKRIEGLQTITTSSFIYSNYTIILEADDLPSSFTCTNGLRSCNLTTRDCKESTTPMPDFTPAPSNSSTITKLPTPSSKPSDDKTIEIIIGVCIGFLVIIFLVFLYSIKIRRKNSKQNQSTGSVGNIYQHERHQQATNNTHEIPESVAIENQAFNRYDTVGTDNTKPDTTDAGYLYAIVNK